jgi:hypothetical protein
MSKVKITFMEEELSTEEPEAFADLLEVIKEKFEGEEILNVSNDELLIKDGNGNEIKNNEDYDKYIKQTASNKIIKVSLRNEEQKAFSLLDFKDILDEKYNEEEELEKIKKERKTYINEQKKLRKPIEEEGIKYDSIFDEFTYIANATNKNVLSNFWKLFKDKCLVRFLRKVDELNNKHYSNFSKEISLLKDLIEKNNEEIKNSINNINYRIDAEKKEIKTYIGEQNKEIKNYIEDNSNININNIKQFIVEQNNTMSDNINNKLTTQNKEIHKIEDTISQNKKYFEEQIKNKSEILMKEHQKNESNLGKIYNKFDKYFKDINSMFLKTIPLKAKIELLKKDIKLKDLIEKKAKLIVNIKNLSKTDFNNCILKCIKEKDSLFTFKDVNINIPEKKHQDIEISLERTEIKEYEDQPSIHMILYNDYGEEINNFFDYYEIKN